jgi:hypothetical protein
MSGTSNTPRDDEFRDPTAPSEPRSTEPFPGDLTAPIDTSHTQEVPQQEDPLAPPPAAPQNPYAQPPTGAQPPQSPYATRPPEGGYPPPPGYGQPQQNPYAQAAPPPPAYGQQAYGQQAYGQPGYGANPYPTRSGSMSGNTIALLIVSGLTTLSCGFGVVALVFAIIAATKNDQPEDQAKFTRWGWWALGITVALGILAIVVVAVSLGWAWTTSGDSSGGY